MDGNKLPPITGISSGAVDTVFLSHTLTPCVPQEFQEEAVRPTEGIRSMTLREACTITGLDERKVKPLMPGLSILNSTPFTPFVDVSKFPLYTQFLPGYLPKGFWEQLQEIRDQEVSRLAFKVKAKIKDISVQDELLSGLELMTSFQKQLPFWIELGLMLKDIYHNKTGKQVPDVHVEDYADICNIPIYQRCVTSLFDNNPYIKELLSRQTIRVLLKKDIPLPIEHLPEMLNEALDNLAGGGIQPGRGKIFLGFVPSEYADVEAQGHGFYDSEYSMNFAHGPYSHLLQLTILSRNSSLTQRGLKTILEKDVWWVLLDNNFLSDIAMDVTDNYNVNGHACWLLGAQMAVNNGLMPDSIHERLSTGEISETLDKLAMLPLTQQEYISIGKQTGLTGVTKEKLQSWAKDVRVAETVLGCHVVTSQKDIAENLPDGTTYKDILYRRRNIGSYIDGDIQRKMIDTRARKYFLEGRRMTGYRVEVRHQHEWFGTRLEEIWHKVLITDEAMIHRCKSFVIDPKQPDRSLVSGETQDSFK